MKFYSVVHSYSHITIYYLNLEKYHATLLKYKLYPHLFHRNYTNRAYTVINVWHDFLPIKGYSLHIFLQKVSPTPHIDIAVWNKLLFKDSRHSVPLNKSSNELDFIWYEFAQSAWMAFCSHSYPSSPPSSSSSPGPSLPSFPSLPSPSASLDCALDLGRGANFPDEERHGHASQVRLGRLSALHPHWLVVFVRDLEAALLEMVSTIESLWFFKELWERCDTQMAKQNCILFCIQEFERDEGKDSEAANFCDDKTKRMKQHTYDNIE